MINAVKLQSFQFQTCHQAIANSLDMQLPTHLPTQFIINTIDNGLNTCANTICTTAYNANTIRFNAQGDTTNISIAVHREHLTTKHNLQECFQYHLPAQLLSPFELLLITTVSNLHPLAQLITLPPPQCFPWVHLLVCPT